MEFNGGELKAAYSLWPPKELPTLRKAAKEVGGVKVEILAKPGQTYDVPAEEGSKGWHGTVPKGCRWIAIYRTDAKPFNLSDFWKKVHELQAE